MLETMSRATRPFRPRVDQLAARVRWLDRYRRLLAIGGAAAVSPFLIAQLGLDLGTGWPQLHMTLVSLMLSVIVWWVVEVGLVYVTALWETEQYRLADDRGLPRAILHRPGRRL
jgi:hypothetical protein